MHSKLKIEAEESNLTSEATTQTRWIFSLLGVWPMIAKKTTIFEKYLSISMHIICQTLLAFVIIPAIIQLCWREINMRVKLAYCGALVFSTACAIKYLTIIRQRKNFKKCIEQLEEHWILITNKHDRVILMKFMKMGKKITSLCSSIMYCGGVLHQIMIPFLPGSIVSIVNNSTKRLLVYPVYDIMFDDQVTPIYEILYLIHIITGMIVCTIEVGCCHLSVLFITHVLGLNHIMISKLEKLIDIQDKKEKNVNQRMTEIIKFHHKIIKDGNLSRFSSDVEKSLRELCMIAVLEALSVICLAEYYSMMAWNYNETFSAIIYFILVQAFIGNFFIFCHIGELLNEKFRKVGEAVYMTEWYCLSQKNARAIILIIAATQHPPKITAGGLMELSYRGFISIIKSTVAFFNILRMVKL